jgi:hypothetical protein
MASTPTSTASRGGIHPVAPSAARARLNSGAAITSGSPTQQSLGLGDRSIRRRGAPPASTIDCIADPRAALRECGARRRT